MNHLSWAQLVDYWAGDVNEAQEHACEEHLFGCEACTVLSSRVAALSDQELVTLAQHFDELPAGGSALGVIGVVFIVLLILELVGAINIFNRI